MDEPEFLRSNSTPRRSFRSRGLNKELPESKIPGCAKACARRNECLGGTHLPISRPVAHARFLLSARVHRIGAGPRSALRGATFQRQCFARSKDRHAPEFLPSSRHRGGSCETIRSV